MSSKSTKGGRRRSGQTPQPAEGFQEALWKWCESNSVNELGRYECITRNQAAHASSLVKLDSLLQLLMRHSRTLEFHMTTLREALVEAVRRWPSLNTTKFQGQHWAALKAERLMTISAHFRRLATDQVRLRQASTKCTGEEMAALQVNPSLRSI